MQKASFSYFKRLPRTYSIRKLLFFQRTMAWESWYKSFSLKSTLLMSYVGKGRIEVEKCGLHHSHTEIETMILLHTHIFLPTDIEF